MPRALPPLLLTLLLTLLMPLIVTAGDDTAGTGQFGPPVLLSQIRDEAISESSGLALSQLHEDVYWTLNDSNNDPQLFAFGRHGRLLSTVEIDAENIDWEALSSTLLDDVAYLVVGDVGDNHAERPYVLVHFVPEPRWFPASHAEVEFSLEIHLTGGPADIESIFVDGRHLYLLTKREATPQLHRVAIDGSRSGFRRTERLVGITNLPQPPPPIEGELPQLGPYSTQPTDMAVAPDHRALAILTYARIYYYERCENESWAQALKRSPMTIDLPPLIQAEALTFNGPDRLLFTSEKWPTPLVEITREP